MISQMKKRLIYQSWHRGIKEADLILGPFADKYISEFSEEELYDYARILEIPDNDFLRWIFHQEPPPEELNSTIMQRLVEYSSKY